MFCSQIFRMLLQVTAEQLQVCHLQTSHLCLFLLMNRKFCSTHWALLRRLFNYSSLCAIKWWSPECVQGGTKDSVGPGTMGWRRNRRQRKQKTFSISVMSNHCFSLSCTFNFTHILNAWKTCWTQYKEKVLASLQNELLFHVHFNSHFAVQI